MTDQPDDAVLATPVHRSVLWTLTSAKERADPWGEISVFARMTGPDGATFRVPAFWDGGATWRVRLTAAMPGEFRLESECSDAGDAGLHGRVARLRVDPAPAGEPNPLYAHGAVRVAGRHFEHLDGTPFPWLADTWWMLMSERVSWPEDFGRLVERRVGQGFSLGLVVVGFQPDTTPFDGRDANAGGSPWMPGYASINPAYFQAADRRLGHMVERGLAPCILGGWGYHMLFMGRDRMISHWRYLVARYAAWPVLWCLAGEGAMPYYLSTDAAAESEALKGHWPEVARAVRELDPWRRPLTIHPRRNSWDDTAAPAGLDFHMIQPGHFPDAPKLALTSLATGQELYPDTPVVNAEPPYEGHGGTNWADVQRYSFWSSMLSGAAGYTYGAAGIFQANDRDRPTGNRPDGGAFDHVFWDDAMMLPGADQVAAGHALLVSLDFHLFTPHPEWAELPPHRNPGAYPLPVRAFAAGIPGRCRVVYLPLRLYHWNGPRLRHLEPGLRYQAAYVQTDTLRRHEIGEISGDAQGEWQAPDFPHMHDWVLLLTAAA